MKIQWQSRRFFPDLYGGVETRGYELVRMWRAMGHQVSVMAENYPDGRRVEDEPLPGVKCMRIRTAGNGVLWRIAPWARVVRWAWHQREGARGAEVVVAAYPECAIASKLAMPNRSVLYNCVSVSNAKAFLPWAERVSGQQLLIERLGVVLADRVVVATENLRRQVAGLTGDAVKKVSIIPHGVEFARFAEARPCSRIAELKHRGLFVAVFFCRLHYEKGVDLAIEALAKMKHRPRTRLLLVGDGPEEYRLRGQAAQAGVTSNVIFVGRADRPETYLAGADVLILPSRYESFGIVLLEAMAAGMPCVGWRRDVRRALVASSEIILDGQTGYCADPYDTDHLASCLDSMAADESLRRRMGRAAQKHCRSNYSWERTAESYLKLARDVIGAAEKRRRGAGERHGRVGRFGSVKGAEPKRAVG